MRIIENIVYLGLLLLVSLFYAIIYYAIMSIDRVRGKNENG